ncbi:hypothetical protein E2C01_021103 [Portunus trituberculatus]|uniref:Uncharacterized protein n=1 Tax=Portunus trituberculatus TaxID=210409 RepID=A0A5B7E563_PORTR|nr:hypothetical protein [Portunus trituberculatus]
MQTLDSFTRGHIIQRSSQRNQCTPKRGLTEGSLYSPEADPYWGTKSAHNYHTFDRVRVRQHKIRRRLEDAVKSQLGVLCRYRANHYYKRGRSARACPASERYANGTAEETSPPKEFMLSSGCGGGARMEEEEEQREMKGSGYRREKGTGEERTAIPWGGSELG